MRIARYARNPKTKSQLEVCGATTITNFRSGG